MTPYSTLNNIIHVCVLLCIHNLNIEIPQSSLVYMYNVHLQKRQNSTENQLYMPYTCTYTLIALSRIRFYFPNCNLPRIYTDFLNTKTINVRIRLFSCSQRVLSQQMYSQSAWPERRRRHDRTTLMCVRHGSWYV